MGGSGSKVPKLDKRTVDKLKLKMNLTDDQLNAWHKEFLQDYPSGYMTKDEFKNIYRRFFPDGNAERFAEHAFNVFDEGNNGNISFVEFLTVLGVTKTGTPEEKLRFAFKMYDTDHDGYLSHVEMLEIVTAIYEMIGNNVELPEDERDPEHRVNKIFKIFDVDETGHIDLFEFSKGAKYDPTIRYLLNID